MVDVRHSLAQLQALSPLFPKAAVAIGNFDGVHEGHAHILRLAVKHAKRSGAHPVALTFDPHPRAVVGDGAPPALATPAQRLQLMRDIGIGTMLSLQFDKAVAGLSPEQFVEDVLVRGLRAQHVIVGADFRFGRRATGTTRLLTDLGRQFGYEVHTASPILLDEQMISSSLVRTTLAAGDVVTAARLLGRNYVVTGVVVPGEKRGATLGFPTANVAPEGGLLVPGAGVYLARAGLQHEQPATLLGGTPHGQREGLPAVAVVSDKPTFGYGETVLEVHVLDFDENLLGQPLRVEFLDRLRDVMHFASTADLRRQMSADIDIARQRFRARAIM